MGLFTPHGRAKPAVRRPPPEPMVMPVFGEGKMAGKAVTDTQGWGIPSGAKNKKESADVLMYMQSAERLQARGELWREGDRLRSAGELRREWWD